MYNLSGDTFMSMAPEASLREVIRREQFDLAKLNACMEKLHYYSYREYNQPHPSIIKKYRSTGILRFQKSWPFNERQDDHSQRSAYFFTKWNHWPESEIQLSLARFRPLTCSWAYVWSKARPAIASELLYKIRQTTTAISAHCLSTSKLWKHLASYS